MTLSPQRQRIAFALGLAIFLTTLMMSAAIVAKDGTGASFFATILMGGSMTAALLFLANQTPVAEQASDAGSTSARGRTPSPAKQRTAKPEPEKALAESSAPAPEPSRKGVSFEQTMVGTAELDSRGIVVAVNEAMCSQAGLERDQLLGQPLTVATHTGDQARHESELDRVLSGEETQLQIEHRYRREDGSDFWVVEHIDREGEGDTARIYVQCQDITHRRQATWELARQALHDELTGLPNRSMLLYRLRAALQAAGANTSVGVMFVDVDRFKMVNDSLGHDVGDQLIKHISAHIGTAIRAGDTVSRFGGDEFVVLCPELEGDAEAIAVAERIRRATDDPFDHQGTKVYPTVSIGIATCAPGEFSADDLMRDADAAMYRAKELGRNRIEFFDETMRTYLVERMELESDLRGAIRDEAVSMHYQSIVELGSGATVGFESLLRWAHPTKGLLTPGQFLPTAEEAGLQSHLDTVALRKTCNEMATWGRMFPSAQHLYVSSNIVPRSFVHFVDRIDDALRSSGLAPEHLMIEVVESALLDDTDGSLEAIGALKEMGVSIAIDDFGTGYSSLSYLTQFKPDKLKIDRSFVSRLPEDEATVAIVRAISGMADALGIAVIAEGVETMEQAAALHRFGIPLAQGFLFAKPRSAEEITDWLEHTSIRPEGAAILG